MKVILSPARYLYLDMKYDSLTKYGKTWAGNISVHKASDWNIEKISAGNAIGINAPLWTETISNIDELEYMAFPRVIGFAELGWTNQENRDWENYKERLANQVTFLDRMKVNYYPSPLINWRKKK